MQRLALRAAWPVPALAQQHTTTIVITSQRAAGTAGPLSSASAVAAKMRLLSNDRDLRRRLGARITLTPDGPDITFGSGVRLITQEEDDHPALPASSPAVGSGGLPQRPKRAAAATFSQTVGHVVPPLSVAVLQREAATPRVQLSSSTKSDAGLVAVRSDAWLSSTPAASSTTHAGAAPCTDAASPVALTTGPLAHQSREYVELRSAAQVGDWELCRDIVQKMIASVATSVDGGVAFVLDSTALLDPEVSARFVTACGTTCAALAAEIEAGSSDAEAASKALVDIVDVLCQLRAKAHAGCLAPPPPASPAAIAASKSAYMQLARIAASCRKANLQVAVLELDRLVVWPVDGDGKCEVPANAPRDGLRKWHTQLFGAIDDLDLAASASAELPDVNDQGDHGDDGEVSAPEGSAWQVALSIYERRAAAAVPTGSEVASDAEDPCVIGAGGAALVMEMLQRGGQTDLAASVLAGKLVSKHTRRDLSRAYTALIGAWTKTDAAHRSRDVNNAVATATPFTADLLRATANAFTPGR